MRTVMLILILGLTPSCVSAIPYPAEDRPDLLEGRRLYIAKCSGCHVLHVPSEYDDRQWEEWVEKMMGPAKITPREGESIRRYVLSSND